MYKLKTKCWNCKKKLSNRRKREKKHYCSVKCKREYLQKQIEKKTKKKGIGFYIKEMKALKSDPNNLVIIKKFKFLQNKIKRYRTGLSSVDWYHGVYDEL